jgi:hypothetical protein
MISFVNLALPTFITLLLLSSVIQEMVIFDNILKLKSKSWYDYIQECCFQGQVPGQKLFIFKMSINGVGSGISFVT